MPAAQRRPGLRPSKLEQWPRLHNFRAVGPGFGLWRSANGQPRPFQDKSESFRWLDGGWRSSFWSGGSWQRKTSNCFILSLAAN